RWPVHCGWHSATDGTASQNAELWTGAPSVSIILDLEPRKRAQDVRRVRGQRGVQIGAIEFSERVDAEQAETALHLVFQELQQPHHAGLAAGGECKALHAAHADQVGARGHRLDDVATAAK